MDAVVSKDDSIPLQLVEASISGVGWVDDWGAFLDGSPLIAEPPSKLVFYSDVSAPVLLGNIRLSLLGEDSVADGDRIRKLIKIFWWF